MRFCSLASLVIFLTVALLVGNVAVAQSNETVRVMSFNLWHGGDAGRQPLSQTVKVIKESKADIVGIQEGEGNAPNGEKRPDNAAKLARELGWNYFAQPGRRAIISRFKMIENTSLKDGVKLELPSGNHLYTFNVHLNYRPYQPYQLLNIPYENGAFLKTEKEAIQAAKEARGHEIKQVLDKIKTIESDGLPIFLTGDFNEPSHLDWTTAAAEAKLCPLAVEWPSTKAVTDAGFVDAFRKRFPDPISHRGLTWTPITKIDDPKDRHDRIDFVFVNNRANARIKEVEVIGESNEYADIVIKPYPSDHRTVVAAVELEFQNPKK